MTTRFLLVDDDAGNLDVLEMFLAPLGARCARAYDGEQALALADRETPDLVILDLSMPGLDGVDVLTHLRRTPRLRDLPVVVVSGQREREDRLRALEAGADDFLEKPVDRAVLLARVTNLLRLKRSRDELLASHEELRRLNALLEERHGALLKAQAEKRELLEFIVHDLKSPLAALSLDIGWIRSTAQADAIGSAAEDAAASARRLQEMVEDLLTVARIDAPAGLALETEPVDVHAVFSDLARTHARAAATQQVSVVVGAPRNAFVLADRKMLARALENLLDNALRYTPAGGRIVLDAEVDVEVVVTVANTGPPIPVRTRERLFEKFARSAEDGRSRGHVGLGLYFCKRVVEAHGGTIALTERGDLRTAFVLRLPAA